MYYGAGTLMYMCSVAGILMYMFGVVGTLMYMVGTLTLGSHVLYSLLTVTYSSQNSCHFMFLFPVTCRTTLNICGLVHSGSQPFNCQVYMHNHERFAFQNKSYM